MRKTYTLCEGTDCPLRDKCARYLPDLDKRTTIHFAPVPYQKEKDKCNFYEPDDDILNELNIVSNQ
jgi:hypothetical protein